MLLLIIKKKNKYLE